MGRSSKKSMKKLKRRLQVAAAALLLAGVGAAGVAGLVTVDRNTRKTGFSHAPSLVEWDRGPAGGYSFEFFGGKYTLTLRWPW